MGILQLGEATLYAAGLGLMEACIKVLTNIEAFEEQVRDDHERFFYSKYVHVSMAHMLLLEL